MCIRSRHGFWVTACLQVWFRLRSRKLVSNHLKPIIEHLIGFNMFKVLLRHPWVALPFKTSAPRASDSPTFSSKSFSLRKNTFQSEYVFCVALEPIARTANNVHVQNIKATLEAATPG